MKTSAPAVVVLAAVAARVAVWLHAGDYTPPYDAASYMTLAESVLAGDGLVVDNEIYGAGLRAMYPPAYPLLLAAFGLVFGVNTATVTVINTLIDVAVAWSIVRLGRDIEAPHAPLAAALYLFWPAIVLSAPIAQKEGLTILLALCVVRSFVALDRGRAGWRYAAGLGTASGLLALTQPSLAVLPVGLGLAFLPRAGLQRLAVAAARSLPFALLVMAPWWLRNWQLWAQFVPLTTSAGHSLMRVVNGWHVPLAADVLALPEPDRSSEMMSRAAARIAADPVDYLQRVGRQALDALLLDRSAVRRFFRFGPGHWLLPSQALYLALLATAAVGTWIRPNRILLICMAGCAVTIFVGIWFEFADRHRYFILPLLLLMAVAAGPGKLENAEA
jgi:4-amino-4-deoxy-L-arabinose transferase-like glycosyltransferase